MSKNLVIVESPAKAKTIEKYLGKDYVVSSSYGHIRDLPKNNKAIDIKNNFKPTYEITKDKESIVKNLKNLVKKSKLIYLASDDDREGESIAWHLKETLGLEDNVHRIVFREITKKAILKAIKSPRKIDTDLVNSQQARRILDRLVGFELSPILWHKIKVGLSAGRVQSVAVKLIVEREREILNHKTESFFKIKAYFIIDNIELSADLDTSFKSKHETIDFLQKCINKNYVIENINKKPSKKSPSAPFTTSTLQQEASTKFGFSVSQTMLLAQKLYEEGSITYMRTDSVNLSDEAINKAKSEIEQKFGSNYVNIRKFTTKSSTAQEAHEAIRPTEFSTLEVNGDSNKKKLYDLIWRRSIASQMKDAELEKTIINISINDKKSDEKLKQYFIAKGEIIKFKGFLEVYDNYKNKENEVILPQSTKIGSKLKLIYQNAREKFTKGPPRFTEASLVKTLEEKGIGRPSTYAPTISTIQKRGYVVKESREGIERKYYNIQLKDDKIIETEPSEITGTEKNKLFPNDIGMIVNDFLVEHFPKITDYGFTATIEEQLDHIAHKNKPWVGMIKDFYGNFHNQVEKAESIERTEVKSSKELGTDPKSGKKVIARIGKYGPLVQIGESTEDEKPKYAPLRHGQLIETITLKEALELFKLPKNLGDYKSEDMTVNIGRFGPYIRYAGKFYPIKQQKSDDPDEKNDYDPYNLTKEQAIEIIEAKIKADKEKIIKQFDENSNVLVLNGRWGPYISIDKKNYKIPKDIDPKTLTLEKCLDIKENPPLKKKSKKK